MKKIDEINDPGSCFNKAKSNELIFILLERDPAAPEAIRAWIAERLRLGLNKHNDRKIVDARMVANLMHSGTPGQRPEMQIIDEPPRLTDTQQSLLKTYHADDEWIEQAAMENVLEEYNVQLAELRKEVAELRRIVSEIKLSAVEDHHGLAALKKKAGADASRSGSNPSSLTSRPAEGPQ